MIARLLARTGRVVEVVAARGLATFFGRYAALLDTIGPDPTMPWLGTMHARPARA